MPRFDSASCEILYTNRSRLLKEINTKMDEKALKRFEYEEQIFHFSSQFFAECFQNFVQDELDSLINGLIKNIKKKLIKESKNPEAFTEKVHDMSTRLKAEYKKSVNMETEKIQAHINEFMSIPDHVLLKEDLPIKSSPGTTLSDADSEVNALKGKFKAMLYLKEKIHEEIVLADSAIFILDNIIDQNDVEFKILDTNEIDSLRRSNLSLIK